MNGNPQNAVTFQIPEGNWTILVDGEKAGIEPLGKIEKNEVRLEAITGMVMVNSN